jgi:ubiquitin-activating enzyme E1
VKEPKQGKHRSFAECLENHGSFLLSDFLKIERPQELHVAFQALEKFQERHGRAPQPGNRADIAAFVEEYRAVNKKQVRQNLLDPHIEGEEI